MESTRNTKPNKLLVLMGWDAENNPSYMIFFGTPQCTSTNDTTSKNASLYNTGSYSHSQSTLSSFLTKALTSLLGSATSSTYTPSTANTVSNPDTTSHSSITYSAYTILHGHNGHFPSLPNLLKLFKHNATGQNPDTYYLTSPIIHLPQNHQITLNDCQSFKYSDYVQAIQNRMNTSSLFTFANYPSAILPFANVTDQPSDTLVQLFSHHSLYMRKKALTTWLATNPVKTQLQSILTLGSPELISGLFLELAKNNNSILINEADELIHSSIEWTSKSFAAGIKRCAKIYLTALSDSSKAQHLTTLRMELPNLDLHLTNLKGNNVSANTTFSGAHYRKFFYQGYYEKHYWKYDYTQRRMVSHQMPVHFNIGPYTDGHVLNTVKLKSTIEEADIYKAADIIGKIAYYLDTPRLFYYFKGTKNTKAYHYFIRKIRRILDNYANHEPDLFIIAMKTLLTSYTSNDCVCKFKNNFQFNYFIPYYLYASFNEPKPTSYYDYYKWISQDHLLSAPGRFEYTPEIWNHHIEDVVYIANHAQVDTVYKACYYILSDSKDTLAATSLDALLLLSTNRFKPLATLALDCINRKISHETSFNINTALHLMTFSVEGYHQLASSYLEKFNAQLTPYMLTQLLIKDSVFDWYELFESSLRNLDSNEYAIFIKSIIYTFTSDEFNEYPYYTEPLPDTLYTLLIESAPKLKLFPCALLNEIIKLTSSTLLSHSISSPSVQGFLEHILFSVDYEFLCSYVHEITFENDIETPASGEFTYKLLLTLKTQMLPSVDEITLITKLGAPALVHTLTTFLSNHLEDLSHSPAHLLALLESPVSSFNDLAKRSFMLIPNEKSEMVHSLFLTSPVASAYNYGLELLETHYKDCMPSNLLLQLLEHPNPTVKAYVSTKIEMLLSNLATENCDLFMYYTKSILLLPNKLSKYKTAIYKALPDFIKNYPSYYNEVNQLLLNIGGSNIQIDSERALTTLALIRNEVLSYGV